MAAGYIVVLAICGYCLLTIYRYIQCNHKAFLFSDQEIFLCHKIKSQTKSQNFQKTTQENPKTYTRSYSDLVFASSRNIVAAAVAFFHESGEGCT